MKRVRRWLSKNRVYRRDKGRMEEGGRGEGGKEGGKGGGREGGRESNNYASKKTTAYVSK